MTGAPVTHVAQIDRVISGWRLECQGPEILFGPALTVLLPVGLVWLVVAVVR